MKGVIFNLLEQVVAAELGDRTWDQIVAGSGAQTEYAPDGTYSHEEFLGLIDETAIALSKSPDETLAWFGRASIPLFANAYPDLFTPHDSAMGFVLTLNEVIHPEVREQFEGAFAPDFEFERVDERTLIISYASYRDLCPFAQGLIEGSAEHYGEVAVVEHYRCQRKGDARCALLLRLGSPDRTT